MILKSWCKMILAKLGYQLNSINTYATGVTEKTRIINLIQSLAPQTTDKALIRLGPNKDGGYLVPNDLDGIEACFSPGVSANSGFEKDCAELGMSVFLADNSVEKPADSHDNFFFSDKYVGVTSNQQFMMIDDWVQQSLPLSNNDLLLQMDIEGFEYEVLLNISEALMKRFRIIVVEFHSIDQLWNSPYFSIVSRAFEKILQTHTCVHIHPNNYSQPFEKDGVVLPPLMEFTFLRHDRIIKSVPSKNFPHPLDYDNTANNTLPLPECWYQAIK